LNSGIDAVEDLRMTRLAVTLMVPAFFDPLSTTGDDESRQPPDRPSVAAGMVQHASTSMGNSSAMIAPRRTGFINQEISSASG
jgi:hypothetical protein